MKERGHHSKSLEDICLGLCHPAHRSENPAVCELRQQCSGKAVNSSTGPSDESGAVLPKANLWCWAH